MEIVLITVAISLACNLIGFVFSYFVLYIKPLQNNRIQQHNPYKPSDFYKRLPLISLNIVLVLILSCAGLYFNGHYFSMATPTVLQFVLTFVVVLFMDDTYFYFYHRYMHENKTLYKLIHRIHHKAYNPIPLEYLYVHPLEWMLGMIGIVLGVVAVIAFEGSINAWAFWAYTIYRNLHELEIHSGLNSGLQKLIPFYGTTESHDLHHAKLRGNYASSLTLWDRIFKTRLVTVGKRVVAENAAPNAN